jgi:CheY-like chemotaxis protein
VRFPAFRNGSTAQDGREALAAFQNHGDRIGLVLLDLTMPHMDGIETFRELRRARKDVRVVVSSGYNRQEATQQFAGKGLAGFIQKPYKAEDLLECVREAWDGDSPVDAPCPDSAE